MGTVLYAIATIAVYASIADSCPEFVTRDQWGARPPKGTVEMVTPVPNTVIHHTVMGEGECNTREECIKVMQDIQNLHMDVNGWDDVGYSFLVGGDGGVYEARGWYSVGAHAPGQNDQSIGISVIGDFTTHLPSELQMNVTKELIECGIDLGTIIADYTLYGHRDVRETECPGNMFYEEIRTWPHFFDPAPPTACPVIVTRDEWGARPPRGTVEMETPVPNTVVHHTEGTACSNRDECIAVMQGIQNLHMDENGWDDIGYSFLVGGDGSVYEGRGWNRVGAHAPGQNDKSIGISLIGNFMQSLPSELQRNVTKDMIACGVASGFIIPDYTLYGHRDVTSTDCPGDVFYEELRTWPQFWNARVD